ncbi:MAG: glutamine--fructose-6-phosphate transaminase (isomerizing), partial [Patescibacteria group bacterium]
FYKLPTENGGGNLRVALERSLGLVVGTYGVAVVSADEPQKIVCARRGSPLVLGVTDDGFFIASDASPLLPYTKKVVYLDDGEVLEILPDKFQIFNLKDKEVKKTVEEIEWSESQAQKGGFPHFMLKEIFEEPLTFQDAWRGRLLFNEGTAHLGGLNLTEEQLREIKNVVLVGCGTAYYACLAGKYIIEQLSDITVSAEIASEFRYRDPVLPPGTLMVAVSQSGETADTLAAMREARQKGATVMGVVNVVGSTIAREAGRGVYIHAGPELAVASTKAFINQLAVLSILGLELGRLHNLSLVKGQEIIGQIMELPDKMKKVLEQSEAIKKIAEKYQKYQNFYFIGRGFNFPVALEGALKLKEVSYIHAEGVAAGELKHGPIALIDENCPVVGIALQDALYDKMMNNLEEIKARRGKIILVATEGDTKAKEIAEDIIYVPPTIHFLEPLLAVIPLHLLAYHMAVLCGRDVDRPRNLAKSVTVE